MLTAMVTPFREDLSVDLEGAARLAEYLLANGTDTIVVAGTTGESPTLSREEKVELFKVVVEVARGKGKVIAGTGSNNTAASVELTQVAEKAGVDGVMLVTPYYNKPPQEALYRHFRTVAESTSLPVMLYNVPGRTGVNLLPETVARLAEVKNITAIKEASGNLDQAAEILRLCGDAITLYSGDDSLTLPMLSVGARGVVSVASHLVGREIKEMITVFRQGQVEKAAELHRRLFGLFKALFVTSNPIPVKTALNMVGQKVGGVRPPLAEAGEKEKQVIRKALGELGLVQ
ncbi:MAG: 4-hydroxy-tetrahydrodipicolinate synthase [Eubacteriales bacterium]|nr:4-hydroxy-tetrahydrodipicolinate synthase [Eubacteriales bacterium]MDN5364608.1 4-hydroxy-tetrahydrodipicolinate synthase [Eubacteriales bacterium]